MLLVENQRIAVNFTFAFKAFLCVAFAVVNGVQRKPAALLWIIFLVPGNQEPVFDAADEFP